VWLGEALPSTELQPLVDKLKPSLLIVSASSCAPAKTVERYQAELKRAAEENGIGLAFAGSGPWASEPNAHRLVTFEDLRALLAGLYQT
jgi:hypothetical protein